MNFTIDPTAAMNGSDAANGLWRSKSLKSMALALGLTASAIVITAGHQIAVDEGRNILTRLRATRTMRRERNSAVLCALLASDDIPVDLMKHLEEERDAFRAAIRFSLDPEVPVETQAALRRTLRALYAASQHQTV
jgi:hypothetical protein